MKISCAILAGGQSRRFKRDKTVATLNGVTFTEILTKKLLSIFDDVMIISKDPKKFNFNYKNITFLKDFTDNQSPLVGIITALQNAKYESVFIVSADAPFLKTELVKYLSTFIKDYDIVLTKIDEKINTLCGFYNKKILSDLINSYENGEYKIIDAFKNFNIKFIDDKKEIEKHDKHLLSFININTLEDYENAKEIAKKFGI